MTDHQTIPNRYRAPQLALCIGLAFFWLASMAHADTEFPGRSVYSQVKTINTEDMARHFDQYQIVDVRSRFEFDTLHIKDAAHVPLYDPDFISKIKALRKASGDKPLVVYCNGRTCYKSYKAADKIRADIPGVAVYAYDAGVFDWAKAEPALTELLGKSPIDPKQLLSKADLKKHLLSPAKFAEQIYANPKALVIDIRSSSQRRSIGLFGIREDNIPLEQGKDLADVVSKAIREKQPLYVYDMAGKQVRWLQYYLKSRGLKQYYFMKGGYRGFLKGTESK